MDNYLDVFLAYILDYAANLTQLRLYILSFSVFANRRGQHPTTSERNVELYLEFLFHCIAVKQEESHTILLMIMIILTILILITIILMIIIMIIIIMIMTMIMTMIMIMIIIIIS